MGGRLQGKIAIITGAAQGMGAQHARVFVAEGAQVMLTDLQESAGAALAAELGASARFMRHDISSADDWDAVIAATRGAFGPANVLLNNAGMYFIGPVDEADPERVRKLLEVNIYGTWLGNWVWRIDVPWIGLTTNNPPLAAGVFYCVLDFLVMTTVRRYRNRELVGVAQGA